MARANQRKQTVKRLEARLERVRKAIAEDSASKQAYRAELLDAEDPKDLDEVFSENFSDFDPEETPIETLGWVPVPYGSFGWLDKNKAVAVIPHLDWVNRTISAGSNHVRSRRVKLTIIDDIEVSTVFIGVNAGRPPAKPLWFESFVKGGELDNHKELYMTWDEAESGHETIVAMIRLAKEQQKTVTQRIERTRRNNRV